ncbi:MAG: indoleamine 2,3-dioxygenase [Pseudomonadota bacterium]
MLNLADYDMSPERGFLCRHNANDVVLGDELKIIADVAMRLPDLLPTGRVRQLLRDRLPVIELPLDKMSDAEARLCMVHYSFMVQAYVWGEPRAPEILPRNLAVPMVALADHLGQQPLLPYSGYVLDNWGLIDPDGAIDLDNIYMIQNFLNGQDENWFVLIHVAIEAAAGAALARFGAIIEASRAGDVAATRQHLEDVAATWAKINAIFDRMPERCDPYVYFERVRPYIHGWKDNPAMPKGIIYEGVARYGSEGQAFRGQTGSQSSIVPAMDALMGVGHATDPLREYLDQLHIYRPPAHRRFIDDTRAASQLRKFVERAQDHGLTQAYNAIIQAMADFRTRHLEYAASYINKQNRAASGNDTDVGTGGTPFMRYLKKHRDETSARLIGAAANAA